MFQRGETYIHQRKYREDSTPTNVDSSTMVITYPCDSGTTSAVMTNISIGVYQGDWAIPSSATYGEYRVSITAVTGTEISKFEESFYVLPWNISQQVRSISGIKQSNDIDDDDIGIICWNAYIEAKEDCFKRVFDEGIKTDSAHLIDGTNKTFYAKRRYLVSDHAVCNEDAIYGMYKVNATLELEDLTISISDAEKGKLSIADKDGNALDTTICSIFYSYRVKSQAYQEQLFKKAVVYLASHEIILRFNELDKATLADLQSNSPLVLATPRRMMTQYKKVMKKIKMFRIGGV